MPRTRSVDMANRMSEQTKQKLLDAFFELLKVENYEKIAIIDITEKAAVSRRSFYRAYESKADLLNKYLDGIVVSWRGHTSHLIINSYSQLIDEIFKFWTKYISELTVLVKANLSFFVLDKLNTEFPKYFDKLYSGFQYEEGWVNQSEKEKELYIKYMFRLSIGALWNVFSHWLLNPDDMTREELVLLVKSGFLQLGS
mgnify:CR=1 FL=1